MKRAIVILLGILIANVTFVQAAETNKNPAKAVAAVSTNSPSTTNRSVTDIIRAIDHCYEYQMHRNTTCMVALYNYVVSGTIEIITRAVNNGISTSRFDRGYEEDVKNTIFVVIEPENKVAPKQESLDKYMAGICVLALGNEANVLILDLTKFNTNDKAKLKAALVAKLENKSGNARDLEGNKLDYKALFKNHQINTIGMVAEDITKPGELTPIHSLDNRYEEKVEELMDKAHASYLSWRKKDEEKKALEEKQK